MLCVQNPYSLRNTERTITMKNEGVTRPIEVHIKKRTKINKRTERDRRQPPSTITPMVMK